MTPEQFCYWLQGFSEIQGSPPNDLNWKVIQDHLKLVFVKKTPEYKPNRVCPTDELKEALLKNLKPLTPIC